MKLFCYEAPETEDIGLADNDIDGFLKNLLTSVNRESAQNSNDEFDSRPVKMDFDLFEVPEDDIPEITAYREVIERCYKEAEDSNAIKAKEFFGNARKVLSEKKVKVLSISDEGTKGAGGDFKKGGKFFTLVVSKGRTDKDNLYSAGSFGIGKNAAFAGSQLRCVFYSSRYDNDTGFCCMGKSVLTSWRNDESKNMSNKVFFVDDSDDLSPVTVEEDVPEWLRKDEKGLKVSIIAPRIELKSGWKHGYIASLLSNFFVAIFDGDLEFSLDNGSERLNKATMLDYFSERSVVAAAEEFGEEEQFMWAKACTEAFLAGEFLTETVSVKNLGDFEVLIKVSEDLPKKVCIVRNGMFITNTLHNFGKPLERFPSTKDFIAIVRPLKIEDQSSATIKRMENPEHSELTTSYIADEDEVAVLNIAMKKLEQEVRSVINKHAKLEVKETRDIEEMREFFKQAGDEADDDNTDPDEQDPTAVATSDADSKGFSPWGAVTRGKGKGGSGRQGGKDKKRKKTGGPGRKRNGDYQAFPGRLQAVKIAGGTDWVVKVSGLPAQGALELWPEEESRSGRDKKPIHIKSCSISGSKISTDRLSVEIPLITGFPASFSMELGRDVNVIDLRPVVREAKA